MLQIRSGIVCIALMVSTGGTMAQDIVAGARIARTQCSSCHQISNEPGAKAGIAPSFVDITNIKGTTQLSIEVFLSTTHEKMPNYVLGQEQIANVAAYIISLRGTGSVGQAH
jgi:mono/diheme cytochrome c family protein